MSGLELNIDSKPAESIVKPQHPTLAQIYAMYDYQDPAAAVEQRNLEFEWSADNMERMYEAVRGVLDCTPSPYSADTKLITFDNNFAFRATLQSVDSQSIVTSRFLRTNSGPIAEELIAEFQLTESADEPDHIWVLNHRFVSTNYRKQDVGSKILQIMEKGTQYLAHKEQKKQILNIEAKQLGVINFALKNGYEPSTDQDKRNLELIYQGDQSRILITTSPGFVNNVTPRPGFIFSIEVLQKIAQDRGLGNLSSEEVRHLDLRKLFSNTRYDHVNPMAYETNALAITFKKEKLPKN